MQPAIALSCLFITVFVLANIYTCTLYVKSMVFQIDHPVYLGYDIKSIYSCWLSYKKKTLALFTLIQPFLKTCAESYNVQNGREHGMADVVSSSCAKNSYNRSN